MTITSTKTYLEYCYDLIKAQKESVKNQKCCSGFHSKKPIYYHSVEDYCTDIVEQLLDWQNQGKLDNDLSKEELLEVVKNA